MNRWADWWRQASRDLAHAGHALADDDCEWAAFAAQQAAEKAIKAIILGHGGEPWGHLTTGLAEALPPPVVAPPEILDAARPVDELREAARRAAARLPSVRRMLLFGSLQTGGATLRSDADILVVVERSEYADPRERIPDILRALTPLPCPVDLFVVTADELERALREDAPLARIAVTTGLDLL